LAVTDVVVARDKAQRQTRRRVQAPGGDQIVFLRRAIKRNIARVQHQVGPAVGNAENHAAASLRPERDSGLKAAALKAERRRCRPWAKAASPGQSQRHAAIGAPRKLPRT
jgi:hypothetical protein